VGAGEHAGVRERGEDVVLGETAIESDRGAEALYALVDGLPESA